MLCLLDHVDSACSGTETNTRLGFITKAGPGRYETDYLAVQKAAGTMNCTAGVKITLLPSRYSSFSEMITSAWSFANNAKQVQSAFIGPSGSTDSLSSNPILRAAGVTQLVYSGVSPDLGVMSRKGPPFPASHV